jgi:hypothetical protein
LRKSKATTQFILIFRGANSFMRPVGKSAIWHHRARSLMLLAMTIAVTRFRRTLD